MSATSQIFFKKASQLFIIIAVIGTTVRITPTKTAQALTITVTTTTDDLTVNGNCTLREAIQAANTDTAVDACQAGSDADTISLPAGSYTLTLNGANENANATGDLDITANLTIIGAGAAVTNINANHIDRVLHTLSSANLNLQNITIQNGNSLVGGGAYFAGPVMLTGTTFISNTADNGGPMGDGGGAYFENTATLTGTIFISNTASGVGGGSYFAGTTTMANTTFNGNSSVYGSGAYFAGYATLANTTFTSNSGGGAYFESSAILTDTTFISNTTYGNSAGATFVSTATLTNITFMGNTAVEALGGGARFVGPATLVGTTFMSNTAGGGGGAYFDSTVILSETTFTGNTADNSGGAYFAGPAMLTDITFIGNRATSLGGSGGGAYFRPSVGQVTLVNTSFISNTAAWGGGLFNWGTLTVTNSTFSSNTAGASGGGGIFIYDGNVTLNNSTVSGNHSDSVGGGISNNNTGTVTLNSSTISNNTAGTRGGGLFGRFTLRNTILARNSATSSGPDCSFGSITSAGYNLIGNTSDCIFTPSVNDLVNINAKLGPLAGSPKHQPLLSGSPAIDAGNPSGCVDTFGNLLTTDQRGLTRFGRCDIGAYEEQAIKMVNQPVAQPGTLRTYTVAVHNGQAVAASSFITDTLPNFITYIDNSLTATSGSYGFATGVITWTGSISANDILTLTYRVVLSQTTPLGTVITNTASISSSNELINRIATISVLEPVFLPIITYNQSANSTLYTSPSHAVRPIENDWWWRKVIFADTLTDEGKVAQ